MTIRPATKQTMNAEEFFAWVETWGDGERFELVEGVPFRLQSERVGHAERKLSMVNALRASLRAADLDDCRAFPDGVSVRVSDRIVREPDAIVQYGPYDGEQLFAPNPVVVVEVVSPSSLKTDNERKLIDYFAVPSILHYLIVFDDGRAVHHRRASTNAEITTAILGRDATIDLSPPGFSVSVESLFDDGTAA